jgi:hypothetical protein
VKVILDENVPVQVRDFLADHQVTTVQREGWSGVKNGELLSLIDEVFDVMVLADKSLRYQQNLTGRKIAFVELPTNKLRILEGMASKILSAVNHAVPGSYAVVES